MIGEFEQLLEEILGNIASIAIILFEFIGVGIIIWTGITGFLRWLKHAGDTGVYLARGLAIGIRLLAWLSRRKKAAGSAEQHGKSQTPEEQKEAV